jgi:uncharacterized protein YndB with AHSA1/START domain
MIQEKNDTSNRELVISRTLNAPVELVWEVWTSPEHIVNWWGPDGFTNTIQKMDMKPGGEWDLIMHGPDGTDYKNKSVFREIIPFKKIVYDHASGPKFTATIEFTDKGEQTLIRWQMLFLTAEELEQTVKTFKADKGLEQNIGKLNIYLSNLKLKTE